MQWGGTWCRGFPGMEPINLEENWAFHEGQKGENGLIEQCSGGGLIVEFSQLGGGRRLREWELAT